MDQDSKQIGVINLSAKSIRSDPKVNKILNQLKTPYLRRDIVNIFSDQGVFVGSYHYKAQPFQSAFILKVVRQGKNKLYLTLSIQELLDRAWMENTKLSNNAKKVIQVIYEEHIKPHIKSFELALKGIKTDRPLAISRFSTTREIKPERISLFACPRDGKLTRSTFCRYECDDFIEYIKITKQVICREITHIYPS